GVGPPAPRPAEATPLAPLVGTAPEPPANDVASPRDHLRAEVARTARVLAALLSSELVREAALREAARARLAARHDPLTGLLNRAGWDQVLADEEERASRYSLPAAVAIIDLDELKSLNDAEGHHAGDELLRRAADVLRIWHRRNDHVARLGGDEFAALLVQTSESDALDAAQRLRRDLADAGIAASVGTAGRWANGTLPHAVLAADRAMYADKRQRRRARRDCA
ncbi:GGDEF domain-containing protein, partial [Euzebya sp.]|uniref:GGDEF domain-containing protein n=1 Tax=Euzebya sp. TaxID=1971409 RepID=UPI003512ECB2